MRSPNIRSFLGRHTVATQAGLALVAATGLAWSNAGLALADLSLPESLPVACASPVGDASAVAYSSPIADLSPVTGLSTVADCSPVAAVSPVSDDNGDTEEVGDDHHRCYPNDAADQRVGWYKWHGDDSKLRPQHRHVNHAKQQHRSGRGHR